MACCIESSINKFRWQINICAGRVHNKFNHFWIIFMHYCIILTFFQHTVQLLCSYFGLLLFSRSSYNKVIRDQQQPLLIHLPKKREVTGAQKSKVRPSDVLLLYYQSERRVNHPCILCISLLPLPYKHSMSPASSSTLIHLPFYSFICQC